MRLGRRTEASITLRRYGRGDLWIGDAYGLEDMDSPGGVDLVLPSRFGERGAAPDPDGAERQRPRRSRRAASMVRACATTFSSQEGSASGSAWIRASRNPTLETP